MAPPPKYLTDDKEEIKEFIDKFDVSLHITLVHPLALPVERDFFFSVPLRAFYVLHRHMEDNDETGLPI